ncbi:diguanylate cyclase [Pseudoalteromonas sp. B193]
MDDFKIINDKYGHDFGDFVLAQTGKRLVETQTQGDFIACRWGGDEFIFILALIPKTNFLTVFLD